MQRPFNGPPAIYVFVTLAPDPRRGLDKPYTGRVATCKDESEIAGIIARDLAAVRQTYGGLIEPGKTKGRTYRAFRAQWTELKIEEFV